MANTEDNSKNNNHRQHGLVASRISTLLALLAMTGWGLYTSAAYLRRIKINVDVSISIAKPPSSSSSSSKLTDATTTIVKGTEEEEEENGDNHNSNKRNDGTESSTTQQSSTQQQQQPLQQRQQELPPVPENKPIPENPSNPKRVFLRYESSLWEYHWIRISRATQRPNYFIDKIHTTDRICHILMVNDLEYVKKFLKATCNYNIRGNGNNDKCVADDLYRPVALNTTSFETMTARPQADDNLVPPVQITSFHDDIMSKFVYFDTTTNQEYVEYIEPLVSYLRHPLSCCEYNYPYKAKFWPQRMSAAEGCYGWLRTSRAHILPPPKSAKQTFGKDSKNIYFDAGASEWAEGKGGPSLEWFYKIWKRHGIVWDKMYAYESAVTKEDFYKTVPEQYKKVVDYTQAHINSTYKDETSTKFFLPKIIQETARKQDYVLFKLDIDSPGVEEGTIKYLMDPANQEALEYIDELLYEFHLESESSPLSYWYSVFLELRQAGVRAHSWV